MKQTQLDNTDTSGKSQAKPEKPLAMYPQSGVYCYTCKHNAGGVCEIDGDRVMNYEWCMHWDGRI